MSQTSDLGPVLKSLLSSAATARQYLTHVQERLHWIPRQAIELASDHFSEPYIELYQSVAFDPDISLEPRGTHVIEVCRGLACREAGSDRISEECSRALGIKVGETTSEGLFTLLTRHCFGRCAIGPNVKVDKFLRSGQTVEGVLDVLKGLKE